MPTEAVGHGAGLKPVTVAPSVTKEDLEQTDCMAEVTVGVVVGGGGMWLNVLEDDTTANVTVVREAYGQAMKVGTAPATRDLPATDLSLMVTVFVAGLVDVFVGSSVGYGPAGVTIGSVAFAPALERSISIGATLLNFVAGPKHCLLKACPLVHSFFGEVTRSDFAKL